MKNNKIIGKTKLNEIICILFKITQNIYSYFLISFVYYYLVDNFVHKFFIHKFLTI